MPELPEVETIRRDLEKVILHKEIKKVKVFSTKVVKRPSAAEFTKILKGRSFDSIHRRGKFLIFSLSSGKHLLIHLKMAGQLIWGDRAQDSRVIFSLSDGSHLNFKDRRLLAGLWLVDDPMVVPLIRAMGPEPLDGRCSLSQFQLRLKKHRAKIKPLLMDQRFIAGLGNIYTAEALFRAKIHPFRIANSLSPSEAKRLFLAIKSVLRKGIQYRGSSINSYVDGAGVRGEFSERLQAYGREGKLCFRCKGMIERETLGGRGTYFCPNCQR